ncbi:hypothetical protein O181_125172 [Austropuccinia psidii MF-1]|uniref:Uncharacterized protein n=1 Tax=Austropuccinia psidii MF-1 TaxID=1389203 RepID=A0A9Q3Q766_9BASI|nr:hypothetical protein [Austropuccinia psidii MF-1]
MSDLNHFEQGKIETQSQYKSWFMVAKTERMGTSSKSLDRNNELISSSEEVNGPRKYRRPSEGLETHVLQRKSPTDKSWVAKPKYFVRGPEEGVGPREGQQPSGSPSSLHKFQKMESKPQRAIRRARKRQSPSETNLTNRTTELQRRKGKPWKMCSIWQEL